MVDKTRVLATNVAGEQSVERASHHLLGPVAKHLFGGRIKKQNPLLGVDRNDGIHGRIDDADQLQLGRLLGANAGREFGP